MARAPETMPAGAGAASPMGVAGISHSRPKEDASAWWDGVMSVVSTRRWPGTSPDADPARKAVLLPGLAYPTELPALWAPMRALALDGWDVWHAAWDLSNVPDDERRDVVREAVELMGEGAARHREVARVRRGRVGGRSRRAPGVAHPAAHGRAVAADLTRSTAPTLLVAGSEDHTWDDDAASATGSEVVRLGPVGHGLMTDDVHEDLRLAGRIADIVRGFAARLG